MSPSAKQPTDEDERCIDDVPPFERVMRALGVPAAEWAHQRSLNVICPAHDDNTPSLSVSEGEDGRVLLYCQAKCQTSDVLARIDLKWPDLFPERSGLTLDLLAEAKGLPLAFVQQRLGWESTRDRGSAVVRIPYPMRSGGYGRARMRAALVGKKRFYWSRGDDRTIAYEPDLGRAAKARGFVLVVEGETDAAVCCLHGVPVLGLPGSKSSTKVEGHHLEGVNTVYFMREPDDGGSALAAGLPKRLERLGFKGDVREVVIEDAKDIADLHRKHPNDFEDRLKLALRDSRSINGRRAGEAGRQMRPQVILTDLATDVAEAVRVLGKLPIYQRGGELVELVHEPSAARIGRPRPVIHALADAVLRLRLCEAVDWVKEGEGGQLIPSSIPAPVLRAVHELRDWPCVPVLAGVSTLPVMRPDGSFHARRGYDPETGWFCDLGLPVEIPSAPTSTDVAAARAQIEDILSGFPFEGPSHLSAAVASMLTLVARPAIDGPVPALVIDANVNGSGKTLLASVIGELALGRVTPMRAAPTQGAEWNKTLHSIALSGEPLIIFDNVRRSVASEALEASITSGEFASRVLGVTQDLQLPWRALVVFTCNNAELGSDMVRRSLHVRLLVQEERPEERGGFRHHDLIAYVRSNRSRLLTALYTILAHYMAAGRPKMSLRPIGSFRAWSDLVRSALVYAGFADPAESQITLREQADEEREVLGDLFRAWFQRLGPRYITIAELMRDLAGSTEASAIELRDCLVALSDGDQLPTARRLGNLLKRLRDRVVGGMALQTHATKATAGRRMRVVILHQAGNGAAAAADAAERPIVEATAQMHVPAKVRSSEIVLSASATSQEVLFEAVPADNDNAPAGSTAPGAGSIVTVQRTRYRRTDSPQTARSCAVCNAVHPGDAALQPGWQPHLSRTVWWHTCSDACRAHRSEEVTENRPESTERSDPDHGVTVHALLCGARPPMRLNSHDSDRHHRTRGLIGGPDPAATCRLRGAAPRGACSDAREGTSQLAAG